MTVLTGADAIGALVGTLPDVDVVAGYSTGSGDVPWPESAWAKYPNAIRICQDPGATDTTADVLDIEAGAATFDDAPVWYSAAMANYKSAARPGQREPAFYVSLSNVSALANTLISAGTGSANIWVADWINSESTASVMVEKSVGPFNIIGVQYENAGDYDLSVYSEAWVNTVSGHNDPPAPPSPIPAWQTTMMNKLPELKNGSTDATGVWFVRRVQSILTEVYGYSTVIDGEFGPVTEANVKLLQGRYKITVDGIVGPDTWSVLYTGSV
jgi:hypothetical protein